jgi:SAM-dependent methyltransferase
VSRAHDFDDRYFARLAVIRDHWWVRGMQEVGAALLGASPDDLRVLDAGVGSGALLPWAHELAAARPVVAIDVAAPAVAQCRALGLGTQLARASSVHLPFAAASFDLVLSSDVLQHLPAGDDVRAVREFVRVLAPGGRVLVRTNCAHGRGHVEQHDDWRLYRPATLRALLETPGLVVDALTPVNLVQGLWATATRPFSRHGHHGAHDGDLTDEHRATHGLGIPEPVHPMKNRALLQLLRLEARYLARPGRRLPFGHSLYAIARKPEGVSPA